MAIFRKIIKISQRLGSPPPDPCLLLFLLSYVYHLFTPVYYHISFLPCHMFTPVYYHMFTIYCFFLFNRVKYGTLTIRQRRLCDVALGRASAKSHARVRFAFEKSNNFKNI